MSSKGVAHRKTKKHHRLNVKHFLQHEGNIPITLGSLHQVVTQTAPEPTTYYCPKCKHSHKIASQIGQSHKIVDR